MRTRLVGAILITAALLVFLAGSRTGALDARAPREAVVSLVAPSSAGSGQGITVQLIAENVEGLAGFEGTVRYDPERLHLTGVTIEEELSRSGRDLMPIGPVVREEEGFIALGAATCPVSDCYQSFPYDAERLPEGVSGTVLLATLTFYATQPGEHEFSLEAVHLVDPLGEPLAAQSASAALSVQ